MPARALVHHVHLLKLLPMKLQVKAGWRELFYDLLFVGTPYAVCRGACISTDTSHSP